MTKLKKKKKT